MKIGGSHKNISYETKFKNSIYSFEETDVPILEKILETAPKVPHNFNQYKANLDTLQTQISTLQFERRINSLKKYGISTLQILGIIALGLGTIYVMYKCKLFECLRRSFPKNYQGRSPFKISPKTKMRGSFNLEAPPEPYALAEQSEAKEGGMSRWS
uniref:uncharacterized protein LOC117164022 n=1 Tax=Bombus vancouverensis nearcticus TaxID=2705178 RepID=UPI0014396441|nr:uncharacterized protein LOC117164022 [Bombus vancouverensis nearcticus]